MQQAIKRRHTKNFILKNFFNCKTEELLLLFQPKEFEAFAENNPTVIAKEILEPENFHPFKLNPNYYSSKF